MSFLVHALDLAARGFHVFPLVPNSKRPAIDDFPTLASRDPQRIRTWWVDPILDMEQPYNVGISTTRFKDDESLIVLDVDNKGKKKGDEEVISLEIQGFALPETLTQLTPTGGRHLVYRNPFPVKQGVEIFGKGTGLDTRAKGGYIVAAGSILDDKEYTWSSDLPVVSAPEWLVQKCGQAPEKSEKSPAPAAIIDQERAIERAIFYLQNEAPQSVKGSGGDQTAYKVAARVKDFGVDAGTCLDIMLEHWFNGSGWTPEKLKAKVDHAYTYGQTPVGSGSPEAQFEEVKDEGKKEEEFYLEKINKEYALVYMEGSHFILHETIDEKGRPKRVLLSEQTFKRRFSPFSVQKSGTYAEVWLDWEGRREYKGLCFAPERDARHGYYNLWRGFTCKATAYSDANADQRRGFDMFIEHVRENVCRNDPALFAWLMGYFAHMVQRPWERPLTTVVFRGGKGVGKNAAIDRVGNLLGSGHYLVAHDGRYLTSNFNGHLDSCLCLVLDEAFWSGDKSAEGKLKGITTAPEIMIERKGKEPYMVDNLVRLIVIGNEDWLVPASADERRYGVFDVGVGKKQNRKYFTDMRILVDEKGGRDVLLHYLQNFDLSTVDVNDAPKTDALHDQKVSSLEPFYQWLFEILQEGGIGGRDWDGDFDKERFRNSFYQFCREKNIRSRLPDNLTLLKLLREVVPEAKSTKRREGAETVWIYRLGTLAECRKGWDRYIGHEVKWE